MIYCCLSTSKHVHICQGSRKDLVFAMSRNGAIEKSTSEATVACLERCVDTDVDIIFSEFVHDDGFDSKVRCYPLNFLAHLIFKRLLNYLAE